MHVHRREYPEAEFVEFEIRCIVPQSIEPRTVKFVTELVNLAERRPSEMAHLRPQDRVNIVESMAHS